MTIQLRFDFQRDEFSMQLAYDAPGKGITAIFGPSGSGKTTLLRAVAGLDRHPDSFVSICGGVWQEGDHFVPVHRRPLGMVFQQAHLFDHLDVQDNIEFGRNHAGLNLQDKTIEQIVEMLDLGHLMHRHPASLSGGEQQRVSLARALAVEPELLLLDEPLASLDRKRKNEILPYLETLHQESKIPVLYVTHSLNEVSRLADNMLVLDTGKLVAEGSVAELFARTDLCLTPDDQTSALLDTKVREHDESFGLSTLGFTGGEFTVARLDSSVGSKIRLRVFARDVSITLTRQKDTSIQNIFSAEVADTKPQDDAHALVRLKLADQILLARLTRKSLNELDLKPGKQVFAQIKSVALAT